MTRVERTNVSCGVYQLSGLYDGYMNPAGVMCYSSWEEALLPCADVRCAFVVFSDHEKLGEPNGNRSEASTPDEVAGALDNPLHRGRKFAAFIEEHKLGPVTKSGWALNPNSGNKIQVYTWQINLPAVKNLCAAYLTKKALSEAEDKKSKALHATVFASRMGKSISLGEIAKF